MVQKGTSHARVSLFAAHDSRENLIKHPFNQIKILFFNGGLGFAEFLSAAE
jgi:hypothetical protein